VYYYDSRICGLSSTCLHPHHLPLCPPRRHRSVVFVLATNCPPLIIVCVTKMSSAGCEDLVSSNHGGERPNLVLSSSKNKYRAFLTHHALAYLIGMEPHREDAQRGWFAQICSSPSIRCSNDLFILYQSQSCFLPQRLPLTPGVSVWIVCCFTLLNQYRLFELIGISEGVSPLSFY